MVMNNIPSFLMVMNYIPMVMNHILMVLNNIPSCGQNRDRLESEIPHTSTISKLTKLYKTASSLENIKNNGRWSR